MQKVYYNYIKRTYSTKVLEPNRVHKETIVITRYSVLKVENMEVILLKFRNWFGHVEYECRVLNSGQPNVNKGEIVYISPNNTNIEVQS